MAGRINGFVVAYTALGGLLLYSGIKGTTLSNTFKDLAKGQLDSTTDEKIGVPSLNISDQAGGSSGGSSPSGSDGSVGTAKSGTAEKMLTYALTARGKPYSQSNPGRFGPDEYDCSGLIWAAATHAGLPMPGGPSQPAAAIVDPELQWLAKLGGASVITDSSSIEAGDVLGFYSSDATTHGTATMNPDGTLNVGSHAVKSMGHIGIATNPMQYMSAYDTAEGCLVNPISGDEFVVGVRLP